MLWRLSFLMMAKESNNIFTLDIINTQSSQNKQMSMFWLLYSTIEFEQVQFQAATAHRCILQRSRSAFTSRSADRICSKNLSKPLFLPEPWVQSSRTFIISEESVCWTPWSRLHVGGVNMWAPAVRTLQLCSPPEMTPSVTQCVGGVSGSFGHCMATSVGLIDSISLSLKGLLFLTVVKDVLLYRELHRLWAAMCFSHFLFLLQLGITEPVIGSDPCVYLWQSAHTLPLYILLFVSPSFACCAAFRKTWLQSFVPVSTPSGLFCIL